MNTLNWIKAADQLPNDDNVKVVTCKTQKGVTSWNRAYYSNGSWHRSGSMSNVIAWAEIEPYTNSVQEEEQ